MQDENTIKGIEYISRLNTESPIPLSTIRYKGIDKRNSIPRFFRPTMRKLFNKEYDFFPNTKFPFAVVLQPFAELQNNENKIPLLDCVYSCYKCKVYGNPWFTFLNDNTEYKCNMCKTNGIINSSLLNTDEINEFDVGTYEVILKQKQDEISQNIVIIIECTENTIANGLFNFN